MFQWALPRRHLPVPAKPCVRVTPTRHASCMATIQLTGDHAEMMTTVDSFIGNLPELLGALLTDGRCIAAIAEFSDHRYVQFWLDKPSYFVAEVISNLNIGESQALTQTEENALRAIGWNEPSVDERPNWFRIGTSITDLFGIIGMTKQAVCEVLGELPGNSVSIRTFDMPRTAEDPEESSVASPRVHELEAS